MASGEAAIGARASPKAGQPTIDEPVEIKAGRPVAIQANATGENDAGNRGGSGNQLSAVGGVVAASIAVTTIAAGGPISSAAAFGSFVLLLGGLSVAMTRVRAP